MRITFLFMLLLHSITVFTQSKISGYIADAYDKPLSGAHVCIKNTNNCCITDHNGNFFLFKENDNKDILVITYYGYKTKYVNCSDSIVDPLKINMEIEPNDVSRQNLFYRYRFSSFMISTGAERIKASFDRYIEFEPDYIKMFNRVEYLMVGNIGGYYNDFYGAFGYGRSIFILSEEIDSMWTSVRLCNNHFKIGYAINSPNLKLIFTPYISLDRLKYSFSTYEKGNNISLSQYLQSQYYSIAFIQYLGTIGWDLDFRLFSDRDNYIVQSLYLSIGSGYYFKLSKRPLIYSSDVKLLSNGYIYFDNFYIQCSLKCYLYN